MIAGTSDTHGVQCAGISMARSRGSRQGGALALLAAVCCWGVAIPLSKSLLADIDPGLLICVQLGASVLVLAGVTFALGAHLTLPPRAQLLPLILIGMLEPGLAYYLELLGLQRTTALHTALILALEPVGFLLLNVLMFHFRRDARLLLSATTASIGVLIVVMGSGTHGGPASLSGDAIVLGGTLAASLYVCLSTQLFTSESLLGVLLLQQTASFMLVVLAGGLAAVSGGFPVQPHALRLVEAAGVGVLQFALAFLFYFHVVRKSSGYWSVVVLNLVPVVGIAASVALLGEAPGRLYFLGAAVCLVASLYTRLREHMLEEQPLAQAPPVSRQGT